MSGFGSACWGVAVLLWGKFYLLERQLTRKIVKGGLRQKQVCDAARRPGLHARYTEIFNKYE